MADRVVAPTRIGCVSDTHGLVRPEVLAALARVDLIVHAGDVGAPEVLERLREVAPVVAVRGNNDHGAWAMQLPENEVVEIAGRSLYLIHDVNELDLDPAAAGFDAVVSGHSHRPKLETRGDVLFLNPGSIGPRRFKLPVALALLRISDRGVRAKIVELAV
ncbi:MAG TPA: metallophosphoesterase family protein [Myxococcota bacterium]|nr:metallophosphoesterase family protein [Myxococcota bacterium]